MVKETLLCILSTGHSRPSILHYWLESRFGVVLIVCCRLWTRDQFLGSFCCQSLWWTGAQSWCTVVVLMTLLLSANAPSWDCLHLGAPHVVTDIYFAVKFFYPLICPFTSVVPICTMKFPFLPLRNECRQILCDRVSLPVADSDIPLFRICSHLQQYCSECSLHHARALPSLSLVQMLKAVGEFAYISHCASHHLLHISLSFFTLPTTLPPTPPPGLCLFVLFSA